MTTKLARLINWVAEILDRNLIMVSRTRRTLGHRTDRADIRVPQIVAPRVDLRCGQPVLEVTGRYEGG